MMHSHKIINPSILNILLIPTRKITIINIQYSIFSRRQKRDIYPSNQMPCGWVIFFNFMRRNHTSPISKNKIITIRLCMISNIISININQYRKSSQIFIDHLMINAYFFSVFPFCVEPRVIRVRYNCRIKNNKNSY